MIKIGTDFSGIGSPEQALIKLGIEHRSIFACDYDKYSKQSYLANYNTDIFYDDITKRNQTQTPYVDLYVAGFPCQAFSMAGNRKGFDDTRGTLFFDLLKYLDAKRPKYFILENVKGLLSHDKGRTFGTILDCLSKTVNKQMFLPYMPKNLGYHVYHKVLNTKDYGIPQNRERIFIVGFREDKHNFNFPKKIPLELKLKDILQDNCDSKYYTNKNIKTVNRDIVGNLSATRGTNQDIKSGFYVDEKYYLNNKSIEKLEIYNKRNEEKGNGFRAKFHNPETDNMSCLKVRGQGADDLITVHSLYPRSSKTGKGGTGHLKKKDGTTYCVDTGNCQAIEVDNEIKQVGNIVDTGNFDNPQRGRIYDPDGISPALNTCGGGGLEPKVYNKKRIRRLTPLECFRLQGFPDSFYHKCKEDGLSDTQLYKQAGNSMTVDVMAHLIKEILVNEKM